MLHALAKTYRADPNHQNLTNLLLNKIDQIPTSLVLAQAAIESAWGTSRFAQKGNNLFGEWCFSQGCGIVPLHRAKGSHHEVKAFASIADSVRSYMLNLNSHPAYQAFRNKRLKQQSAAQLSGCYLASGLINYSEKKERYIESIKQLIRINKLEATNTPHCKPKPPAITPTISTENTVNLTATLPQT